MKEESTISKINSELIRSFASLDAWFDRALDDRFEEHDEWDALDVIRHIIISNTHLLDVLSDGYEYAFSEFDNNGSEAHKSFDAMRFALREQLFHCLCLLDEVDNSHTDENDSKEMNVYEKISSLINHLHYHLERLERSESMKL